MKDNIAIEVKNLSKRFHLRFPIKDENGNDANELWALKDLNFDIKKGESVAIIGPNGSGKSTLLKILAGVTRPTQGSVKIRGRVASILEIGAGFQHELSGRENVYLNGQILGFDKKEIEQKYDEIVKFSGIGKFIEEPVKNYSSGMYLRLAFSIMAHLDFDVYLFDEVLAVGDEDFQMKCFEKIQQLVFYKKTIIVVSHLLSQVSAFTRQAIFILNGQIEISDETHTVINYMRDSIEDKIVNSIENEIADSIENKETIESNNNTNEDTYKNLILKHAESSSDVINEFKINKFCSIDSLQNEKTTFAWEEDIYLSLDYYIYPENTNQYHFGVIIKDESSNSVLLIHNHDEKDNFLSNENKKYLLKWKIPSKTLGLKTFYCDLFVTKNKEIYKSYFNCLKFSIKGERAIFSYNSHTILKLPINLETTIK